MMEHGMQTNVKQNSNTISCYNVFDLTLHIIFFHLHILKFGLLLAMAATCNTVHHFLIINISLEMLLLLC